MIRKIPLFASNLTMSRKKTYIDVIDYSSKTSPAIIDHLFIEENRSLVDTVKFVVSKIKLNMKLSLANFNFYYLLNNLLMILQRIDFYI